MAVDDPLVAVAPRVRLEREQIGARVGLAVALPERRLAARDPGQELAAQGLRAVADDGVGDLERAAQRSERRARRRQLLEQDEQVDDGPLLAAQRARPVQGEPAPLAERTHEGVRVRAGAVAGVGAVLGEALGRVLLEERTHLGGKRALLGAPSEIHALLPGVTRTAAP